MKIQSIRNANMRIEYGGHLFVCDPYLADKFSRPSYTGKSPNPLVDLPMPAVDVIAGAEFFMLSHLHSDHFDPAAADLLPKNAAIFSQPEDRMILIEKGFSNVTAVNDEADFENIHIHRIEVQHGSGDVLKEMGKASGFILSAPGEPDVFWIGDSILTDAIRREITERQPEVIITHSSGAVWGKDRITIVMDAEQTVEVCKLVPKSKVVAVHMEALDHGTVTRQRLRNLAHYQGIADARLIIPDDGEMVTL